MSASPGGGISAEIEREFATPVDIVWAALTRPEVLSVWYRPGAEVDLRAGGFWRNAGGDAAGIVEVEAPHRLVMSWDHSASCPGTMVSFTLTAIPPGSTRVRLAHTGLGSPADRNAMLEAWSWAIDSLEMFLKTGEGVPFEPWRELQTELHRRAATKSFDEAEAERRAAGVTLAPIVLPPAVPPVPAAKKRGGAVKKPKKKPAVRKSAKKRSPPARAKKPGKPAAKKRRRK